MTWELLTVAVNVAVIVWTFRQGWRARATLRKVEADLARQAADCPPGSPYRSLADVDDYNPFVATAQTPEPPPATLLPVSMTIMKYCPRCDSNAALMSTEDLCAGADPRCPQVPHRHVTCDRCGWWWLQGLVQK